MGDRKLATCMNCGEQREMAAYGLCFACYRRRERRAENPWAAAAKHERSKLKSQRKLRTAITGILNAVDGVIDIMEEEHVTAIRSACAHYLAALVSGLPSSESAPGVNSERDTGVNSSQPDTSFDVNTEPGSTVNCSPTAPDTAPSAFCHTQISETTDAHHDSFRTVNDSDANLPLIPGRQYSPRPHPKGGYGVYEHGSTTCLQRHSTEDDAWDAIAETVSLPEEAMRGLLNGI